MQGSMNGHLLEEDEGPEPFAKATAQREQHAQQNQKRIDAQTVRTENCKRLCTPQLWNWKSLVQDPRDASVFLCDPDVISEKIYLLAMAQGKCLLSKAVLHGKPGLKMEYHKEAFRRLGRQHVGVHCSKAFRNEHPEFVKVLAWALER